MHKTMLAVFSSCKAADTHVIFFPVFSAICETESATGLLKITDTMSKRVGSLSALKKSGCRNPSGISCSFCSFSLASRRSSVRDPGAYRFTIEKSYADFAR
jgi:hypothetical protein